MYDVLGCETSKTTPERTVTTTYDLAGRPLTVSDGANTFETVYDSAKRAIAEKRNGAVTVQHELDAAGNRTRLTHADGYFVTYTYDALNRMATSVENGTFTLATFGYDVQSRTTSLTYGNGASVSFGYEPDSDLKEIIHSFVSGGEALAGGGVGASYSYQYTPAHQLKSQSANHPSFQFEPPQTESVAYAINNLNQYTTVTKDGLPSPITYDPNGNLTNDGANTFGYDAENKLTSATMGVGTNVAYEYGPIGRRTKKTVDGTVTEFAYDADHLIAEYDGSGAVLRRYIHGPGTDRPIAMVDASGARSYYHADRLGSVIALTDDSGAESARYTYDAYGVPYLVDPGTGALTQVAAGQPYLFTGRRFDFETGLYYYRARYYSASLGRFLQTDPIGYDDQLNLYAYVGNDPVNLTDPEGEFGWVGALIGGAFQLAREIQKGSFKKGVFTKEGAKALVRVGGAMAVGAVTGGVGSVVSRSVVGLGLKEAAKTITSNAAKNAVIGSAANATGTVAVNTAEVAIDSNGDLGAIGEAVTNGDVLNGAGSAAIDGAVFGAAGSVAGDLFSVGVGASAVFGEKGTLSPLGTAVAVTGSNAMGNLGRGDLSSSTAAATSCSQKGDGVESPC